jgi:hypothetical protein
MKLRSPIQILIFDIRHIKTFNLSEKTIVNELMKMRRKVKNHKEIIPLKFLTLAVNM